MRGKQEDEGEGLDGDRRLWNWNERKAQGLQWRLQREKTGGPLVKAYYKSKDPIG